MSMFYDMDNYELSSNVAFSDLLVELPFELIKESIIEQINDPVSSRTNYIDVILDKYEVFKLQYGDNEEVITELEEHIRAFFIFIMQAINDKFDLGLDLNEIAGRKDMVEIGECLYKYFVIRYVKNITRFITKYIFKNKKTFVNYYNDKTKKDVSTLAYKKQIEDNDDLVIIAFLPSIIKDIITMEVESEDFIKLSVGNGNYEASVVKELIRTGKLIGDFYRPYISMCVDSHDYIIDELQTEIRIKILNKLSDTNIK